MPIEARPANPVPRGSAPPNSQPHRVRDGESWSSLASRYGKSANSILYANFRTLDAAEINWYLRHHVGCDRPSGDGRNWAFSSSANPGIVYIPSADTVVPGGVKIVSGPAASRLDVAALPLETRLKMVIEKTIPLLPGTVGQQLRQLLEPTSLAIMTGVVVVWGLSHFVGIGEVVDVILLVLGVAALGMSAITAGAELIDFGRKTYRAESEVDLDAAAAHLAKAVALIGVETVLAILLKRAPKAFRDEHFGHPVANPGPGPRSAAPSWRYKPEMRRDSSLGTGGGSTNIWGDIRFSPRGTANDRALAICHEKVHQFLTPKLYRLRGLRVQLSAQGYNKSYLLRYLEEALAETFAQLRVNGVNPAAVFEGVRFPIAKGYVTVTAMRAEAAAALMGPINVAGMTLYAYYGAQRQK